MADEDIAAFDGTSPWGDQVSLSNHNSSSSSLVDKGQQQSPNDSTTEAPGAPVAAETAQSPPTTPKASRRKNSRTPIRQPKSKRINAQSVEIEQDLSSNPLGPLGGDDTVTNDKDDDDGNNDQGSNTLHDVPLNNNNHGETAAESEEQGINSKASIDDEISRKFSSLNTHETSAETHAQPISQQAQSVEGLDKFEITVGDPIKVGDITSSHTVYTVHMKTNSSLFNEKETSVTRRYRDFRWVFHALENNNQGIIVPPPPEKQAIGRFNEDFVEARRTALENMLNKMAAHPTLQKDADFRLFLESENFSHDVKNKSENSHEDLMESSTVANHSSSRYGGSGSSGGSGGGGGGFMSSLGGAFSFSGKYVESNEWFIEKKQYLDTLESQLKSLAKALDIVVTQRRELSDATNEFAGALDSLANVEISKSSEELLAQFSQAQYRIKDLYARQCMQDILSLATTLDEYIRLISSIRSVFSQRQKIYFNTQSAEQELNKRRQHLDKLNRQGKTLQDKIAALQEDVDEQEGKVQASKTQFDEISKVIMKEFDRFDHEKIRDFRNSVELFLENAVEAQKEAIEIWETFYQVAGFGESGGGETSVTAA